MSLYKRTYVSSQGLKIIAKNGKETLGLINKLSINVVRRPIPIYTMGEQTLPKQISGIIEFSILYNSWPPPQNDKSNKLLDIIAQAKDIDKKTLFLKISSATLDVSNNLGIQTKQEYNFTALRIFPWQYLNDDPRHLGEFEPIESFEEENMITNPFTGRKSWL